LRELNANKYKDLISDANAKQEFERIVQFLSVLIVDVSFRSDLQKLYYEVFGKVIQTIDSLDLSRLNSRMLSFLISIYGKNSLTDPKLQQLKSLIFKLFSQKKANIFDLVETFSALFNVD
jgi:hypothetical protein